MRKEPKQQKMKKRLQARQNWKKLKQREEAKKRRWKAMKNGLSLVLEGRWVVVLQTHGDQEEPMLQRYQRNLTQTKHKKEKSIRTR